ncbi:nucleotide exchange factor GrpE [Frondihabitans sp. VKM Ac-2883]|uniref:nucleotide exchange factor GrpE n=1 Tax=Frondihabitans sp. VKM Ac-2883 TaxID=2783823 RepID=UPI00188CEB93|nr:nucleotide exchange factor GrpE [Frondihabitans sp. VKM Ac-2883]MBF4575040.1 nucleotide exchange factor GrpE [Frondihabitans sp. VKM Ac-2883]
MDDTDGPETDTDADAGAGARAASAQPVAPDDPNLRLADLEDRWRRAVADLDNLRKRAAREIEFVRDSERAQAASVFLPVVDGLEDAVTYARGQSAGLAEGMQAIREQAVASLERLGYPRIDQGGVPFDPRIHEVVSVVDRGDRLPRTVVVVARLGFGTPDRLLRAAGVVVTSAEE